MNKGIVYAFWAYFLWGLFPLYWKQLQQVPAIQLIGHRILWSFILLVATILVTQRFGDWRKSIRDRRVLGIYLVSGLLVSVNWLVYVWGVNEGFIVESSLGYFINPLISVLLGVFILRERLRSFQWLPVVLAAIGVVYLTIIYGRLPWIALTLAMTFGLYGLVKKLAPLSALYGLTLEMTWMAIPALVFLTYQTWIGKGAFLNSNVQTDFLLVATGLVTTIPLILFSMAAQRVTLTVIGIMQYIAPTLQFLLGVLVYHEPFTKSQLVGFGFVWLALIMFWVEGYYHRRARLRNPVV